MTLAERADSLTIPASALHFWDALVEHSYSLHVDGQQRSTRHVFCAHHGRRLGEDISRNLSTYSGGTINKSEAKQASVLLMVHDMAVIRMEIELYGRMRPVKEDATGPVETALWEHALSQVYKDECGDLLYIIKEKTDDLADDVYDHYTPFPQACAERVVQHVESRQKSSVAVHALAASLGTLASCAFFRQRRMLERYLLGKTLLWFGHKKDLSEVRSPCRCKGKYRLFTPSRTLVRNTSVMDIFERNHS